MKRGDTNTAPIFIRSGGEGFWEFLEKTGIEFNKKDFPFLTASNPPRIKQMWDFGEYLKLGSRGQALAYLYHGLGRALDYVGPVLDSELPHGFNDHTDRHTLWVAQRGMELLHRAGTNFDGTDYFDGQTEVLITLVGMLHDFGNLLGRKNHSDDSIRLLKVMFKNWHKYPKEWAVVEYAIAYHEEPVLKAKKKALNDGLPLQWALVLADKMHVGRSRIGGRSFKAGLEERAFENDIHILINALVVRSTWYLSAGTYVWHLDFSVDLLQDKFASFSRGNSGRLWVPKFVQNVFVREGRTYRDTFARLFLEHYKHRVEMAAEAAFLLFPHAGRFSVKLSDTDTRRKVGNGERVIWDMSRHVEAEPFKASGLMGRIGKSGLLGNTD